MSLHRDDVRKLRAVLKAAAAQTELVERRTELLERAVEGLSDEQIEAIPQVLSLASELAAMVEIMEEYQPGTDLYTVGEVLKLALAGARS